MTPAQIAKIMSLVDEYAALISHHQYALAKDKRTAVEAALRDAPQAEGWVIPDCGEAGHDEGRCGNASCMPGKWGKLLRNARDHAYDEERYTLHPDLAEAVQEVDAMLAARPSAPTAVEPTDEESSVVEPDERAVLSEMIDSYALAFHAAIVRPESHDKMKAKAESLMDAILARAAKGTT